MPRVKKGTIIERDGKIYARVRYIGADGKTHAKWRKAKNRTDADKKIKELLRALDDRGEQGIEGDGITFEQLANKYEKRRLIPVRLKDGRKKRGLKSLATPKGQIKILRAFFGKTLVRNITHADVEEYKQTRLDTPVVIGEGENQRTRERAIASVNRELALLRAIFKYAVRQNWLVRSPFDLGEPLISAADETRRERVLSRDEEKRLLTVCTGRRAHLKPLLIAALDTAARRGELFKLLWADVNFGGRIIVIRATNTKTARGRMVGLTQRLYDELVKLYERSDKQPTSLVFGLKVTVKTSFAGACKDAGITDFRFHDLRHTGITRLVQAGTPANFAMSISGHTQYSTFARYVNVEVSAAQQAAELLDRLNAPKVTAAVEIAKPLN